MNFRGNIPTKFSLDIFRGDFRQTSDPQNFLGNLFPRNSVGKFRRISEERRNSEDLFRCLQSGPFVRPLNHITPINYKVRANRATRPP
ncbi:hypothetical protein F2Q70_00008956 [Brassica cretica]|uniref:Uncharacterized protein n=1 Tax=Brassica cretica TaxID=69181 RepID=A0A8S9LXQ4_BRACR|nr:hypothetical protein F2Q70_00008956 [Brassica cretica]